MDKSDSAESRPQVPRWRAYTWGVLAALTCPCHLPVLAAVLASTTAGAFIGDHWGVAAVVLAALFFLFLARAIRAFRSSP
ncbi:broad-spectrum mercury transporter MerE [Burkholderia multivorans]|uniref:broad-spectrum mercury transporter MerE n=1 Tax=Burkholderia TaxID=32008 RepID=UPI001AA067D3|nr:MULTISPECIES: broad-spectrum mercury transporter MerE [Burkholderia]HEP6427327.1 broad-spectrum mercury transporter MerE [Burkholderia cenocepacia]MBU9146717.1 broad-spectrum mercury transporter MerE [Burkholderia multivorans]MBU9439130.1 broad-spectrum mercury transporter MerE [Burkholderia multivorans]MBU9540641.1 broad-spectrum mercury transporter MerE [Burkholderia multivorans]MDD1486905.1 broad-spectrum mercury transporter MerE [Burkholderia thailandensis]